MYCQSCGGEIAAGAAVCPRCNRGTGPAPVPAVAPPPPPYGPPAYYPPMYPHPFMFGKSMAAGFFIIFASIFCLIFAIYVLFDWIIYYIEYPEDYYYDGGGLYMWIIIFIWSIIAFGVGLITAVLCFKRTRYKIAIFGSIIVLISAFFMFFDYFTGFGMLTLIFALPGMIFLMLAKRDFDIQAGAVPPYFPPPMMPMPMPPPAAAPPVRTTADKLIDLKKLKDESIISAEEYEAKRQELLKLL